MRSRFLASISAALLLLGLGASQISADITGLTASPSPALVRVPVAVTISGTGACSSGSVDFGDGSSASLVGRSLPTTFTHSYKRAGTFTVSASGLCPATSSASASLTVTTVETAAFDLRRVELRFENGRGEITVPKDFPKLTAFADILFNGSGLLIAAWEVDGRTLAIIHEFLTFGSRVTLKTPDFPPAPTFEPGLHTLKFRVIRPTLSFTIPDVVYYVEARPVPTRIELVSPAEGAALPESPVTFRWRSVPGVASYRLDIFAEGKKDPIFTALTTENTYTVPEHYQRLFTVGGRYSWQVKGLDEKGKEIAASDSRRFTWEPEPGAGTFVSRQVLAGLRLQPRAAIDPIVADLETTHGLRRLDVYDLQSIDTTLILFEIVRPQTVGSLVAALTADPRVLFAQPNFIHATSIRRNDPLAGLQRGMEMMGIPQAHDRATGKGVRVAVIDTGIDTDHPDLKARIVEKANFAEGDGAKEVHGTLVAGIIAANADNRIGIYGAAPEAELLAVRSCRQKSPRHIEGICTAHTLAKGLDFAILKKANVINMSLGGPRDILVPRLIERALAMGITVVAAAGNRGPTGPPPYPAALDNVIAVTAIDSEGRLYPYASHGNFIDLAAPGVEVLSTTPAGGYGVFSGTSMAAAHVSAAAALLLQAKSDLSPRSLQTLLEESAKDLGPKGKDPQFGSGQVNICRVLERLLRERLTCP